MPETPPNPFSAADPALGYLYQVRVALLWSLRRIKQGPDFTVSLETIDDVTFEVDGQAADLLQTKHHRTGSGTLTDYSPDLWKTLRVWFEGNVSGLVSEGTALHLLTTSSAPAGSAASLLRATDRNVLTAIAQLEAAAQASQSEANASAYAAFQSSSGEAKKSILGRVVVLDGTASITELDQELKAEIFWAVEAKHHARFLERLEGWWLRRVIEQLSRESSGILGGEIEDQMADLRDQFSRENLPIDEDLLDVEVDESLRASYLGFRFVYQLEIARASERRVTAGIRDFYRAYEQRSRWLRDELLFVGEMGRYERRLVETWELKFGAIVDELDGDASDEVRCEAARQVLSWAEQLTMPLRPSVTEPFLVRGSLHMLADEVRIGWHPGFRERMAAFTPGPFADATGSGGG